MSDTDAPIPGSRGNRTRNRRLLGIPSAPRFRDTPSNLFPRVRDDGAEEFYPADPIDEVLNRYNGQAVPLDEAFPLPPPPESGHAAIDRVARSPFARTIIPQENPSTEHAIAERAYHREHQFQLIHKLLVRKASMAQVATALGVPIAEAFALRKELHKRIRRETGSIDHLSFSGSTIAFYDEVRGGAMRAADTLNLPHADKNRYYLTALSAENNKHRFLQVAGFYQDFKLRPKEDEILVPDDDLSVLVNSLRVMLDPELLEDEVGDVIENPGGLRGSPFDDDDDMIRVLG